MRAVADAGPLIRFSWIGRLDLLDALFDELLVPTAVWREVVPPEATFPGVEALVAARDRGRLRIEGVRDRGQVDVLCKSLDRGEAEALVLMRERQADLLLVDDQQARRAAQRLGLAYIGTIGLLRLARDRGLVRAAYPIMLELRRRNFWVSDALLERIAREEE